MRGEDWKNLAIAAVLLGIAALLPLTDNDHFMSIDVTIAMYVVLATSWALFSGPTHYISLATAAFFGIGTYVIALGIETPPYWSLLPIAAVIGAAVAALVGLATPRLSGVYFVIFTLGLAETVRQLVTWRQNQTGRHGSYVLTDITEKHIYWQLLGLAALVYLTGDWAFTVGICAADHRR